MKEFSEKEYRTAAWADTLKVVFSSFRPPECVGGDGRNNQSDLRKLHWGAEWVRREYSGHRKTKDELFESKH